MKLFAVNVVSQTVESDFGQKAKASRGGEGGWSRLMMNDINVPERRRLWQDALPWPIGNLRTSETHTVYTVFIATQWISSLHICNKFTTNSISVHVIRFCIDASFQSSKDINWKVDITVYQQRSSASAFQGSE